MPLIQLHSIQMEIQQLVVQQQVQLEDYASLLKKESAKAFLGLEDEDEFDFDVYLDEKRKHYETRAQLHALRKQVL